MKKLFLSIIICLATLIPSVYAQDITVNVNGEVLQTDVAPQIVNDRTMLPMRAIFEKLGATVTWMGADKLIFATKGSCMIVMQIGNNKMSVQRTDSEENNAVELDAAPYIYEDFTLVPVRAVAEALEADVEWVGETGTVNITTK